MEFWPQLQIILVKQFFYAGKNVNETQVKHRSVITRGRTKTKGDSMKQAKREKNHQNKSGNSKLEPQVIR